ncbi:MAG TPA: SOS response-associated peptidase [Anaerolineae bacterium]
MCGRFTLTASGETLAEAFDLPDVPPVAPRYNIAPTQPIVAVRLSPNSGKREFTFFHWGLIPSWSKDVKIGSRLINARSETVTEKPSFRSAFKRRRCLIPATGFFEWQRQGNKKQPMYIQVKDSQVFAFAGLWETWYGADGSEIDSCTILTTEPNDLVRDIHNRMPVIIEPVDYSMWLDPGANPEDGLHLLRPYPADQMLALPVSPVVNNPNNDTPECIAPLV